MSTKTKFYGWKLVAVLWSLDFLNMGSVYYGGAIINTYMLKEIVMHRSTYGWGFTLLNWFVGLPSMLVAASIVRWGIRRTFGIGSALIFAGALSLAFATTKPWQYLVGFGVVAGSGISFGTIVPVSTAVTRWFRRYRGRTMAVTLSASGFAGFFVAPLINRVLSANGGNWRQAWELVAAVAILSAVIAFLFVKERPEDLGQSVDGEAEEEVRQKAPATDLLVTKHCWTPGEAFGTTAYWLIVFGGIACQFPFFFFIAHCKLHLEAAGVSPANAAWAIGLLSIGAVAGRLIGGGLMDWLSARVAFMSGLCCYLAGSVLAMKVDGSQLWIAYTAAILYGTGFGWTFICMNTANAHFFGAQAFPKLNGMAMLVTAVVCAPAGAIGGRLFDVYGNYHLAFQLNLVLAAAGIVGLFFARMPTPPEERRTATLAEAKQA